MSAQGFLAIWCEIGPEDLKDYRNWLTREHIADRIFSPGFLGVRLFSSIANERAHFFLYVTESPAVMSSPSYVHILNNPSPWTQRIMPKFGPFDRAAGERLLKLGVGFGSHVLVSRVRADASAAALDRARGALAGFLELDDVVSVRLLETDRSTTSIASQEKTMRRGVEGDFDYLLVVETISERGARLAQAMLANALQDALAGYRSHDQAVSKMIYGQAPYEGETT